MAPCGLLGASKHGSGVACWCTCAARMSGWSWLSRCQAADKPNVAQPDHDTRAALVTLGLSASTSCGSGGRERLLRQAQRRGPVATAVAAAAGVTLRHTCRPHRPSTRGPRTTLRTSCWVGYCWSRRRRERQRRRRRRRVPYVRCKALGQGRSQSGGRRSGWSGRPRKACGPERGQQQQARVLLARRMAPRERTETGRKQNCKSRNMVRSGCLHRVACAACMSRS